MSFYRLFLDDERSPYDVRWVEMPPGPWTIVRNYDAFVETITRLDVPGFVSFDHDLGAEAMRRVTTLKDNPVYDYRAFKEKTGYHCALWLVEHCLNHAIKIPEYQIHSMNPVGADNIRSIMESGRKVEKSLDTAPQGE